MTETETLQLTQSLKSKAIELGFSQVAVTAAQPATGLERLDEWLRRGYDGEMYYIRRRREAYEHPEAVLSAVQSVVVLLTVYQTHPIGDAPTTTALDPAYPPAQEFSDSPHPGRTYGAAPIAIDAGFGRVAKYAHGGSDYHDSIRQPLRQLAEFHRQQIPGTRVRLAIDTAPLLEREWAQLAGLGWQGKNTLLLTKQLGSWFFISIMLSTAPLAYDASMPTDHCGTCRACLDACPTDAFVQPNLLDARRCISYLTIEHRSPIPLDLRAGIGDWVFGCDICQDVCPWNRKAPATADPTWQPTAALHPLELHALFELNDDEFRQRFRQTPLWRPGRKGLLRNAAIVLGNQRDPAATIALQRGLGDRESLVRGACAWALGQIGSPDAIRCLQDRRAIETDESVSQEISAALDAARRRPDTR